MGAMWSFETIKSFPEIPQRELFRRLQEVLKELDLEIIKSDETSGVIEARKRGIWPFKSGQQISIMIHGNSKVTAVEKLKMGSSLFSGEQSAEDMMSGTIFRMLKDKM